jgi:hypothetical protein
MTIYEKLNEARIRFQELDIKQSGKNDFAHYNYYELSDIIPVINNLAKELGFSCLVSFGDIATLTIVDTEKPEEKIVFTSPMSTANLKGCHDVQNLGAVETYIKRYLYQNAFEIVETDGLNGTHNPDSKTPPPSTPQKPPAPQNGTLPQNGLTKKHDELVAKIGGIMKTVNPDQFPYFSEEERKPVRELVKKTGPYANGIEILEKEFARLTEVLKQKEASFKPIPFENSAPVNDDFVDDIPL